MELRWIGPEIPHFLSCLRAFCFSTIGFDLFLFFYHCACFCFCILRYHGTAQHSSFALGHIACMHRIPGVFCGVSFSSSDGGSKTDGWDGVCFDMGWFGTGCCCCSWPRMRLISLLALLIPHRSLLCPEVLDLDGGVQLVLIGEAGFLYKSCFDGWGWGDGRKIYREQREEETEGCWRYEMGGGWGDELIRAACCLLPCLSTRAVLLLLVHVDLLWLLPWLLSSCGVKYMWAWVFNSVLSCMPRRLSLLGTFFSHIIHVPLFASCVTPIPNHEHVFTFLFYHGKESISPGGLKERVLGNF